MKNVSMDMISKKFNDFQAIKGLSLDINKGEFLSLLGPSGCGKTTTLRILAGFIKSDTGKVSIGDKVVDKKDTFISPEKRNIGMVFQSYAVWPHMDVFKNIAYPLKLKKVPRDTIRKKVLETMEMVGLKGLEDRFPSELSGGQQQRVALGRSLVMEPDLLLLDEPLSNLDAKLREKMRRDIREIQRKAKLTIVFVTHDQEEAIVMSDRIAVMNGGKIEQIGTPYDIYNSPSTEFVATFVGRSNIIPGSIVDDTFITDSSIKLPLKNISGSGPCKLCIRPENINLVKGEQIGSVLKKEFHGNRFEYTISIGEETLLVESNSEDFSIGEKVGIEILKNSFL